MGNTTWKDETVQSLKQGYEERITKLEKKLEKVSHGAVALAAENARLTKENKWRKRDSEHLMELGAQYKELEAEVARLTAGSEAMQEDAKNNTATIKMLMAQLAERDKEVSQLKEKVRYAYVQIEALERVK